MQNEASLARDRHVEAQAALQSKLAEVETELEGAHAARSRCAQPATAPLFCRLMRHVASPWVLSQARAPCVRAHGRSVIAARRDCCSEGFVFPYATPTSHAHSRLPVHGYVVSGWKARSEASLQLAQQRAVDAENKFAKAQDRLKAAMAAAAMSDKEASAMRQQFMVRPRWLCAWLWWSRRLTPAAAAPCVTRCAVVLTGHEGTGESS